MTRVNKTQAARHTPQDTLLLTELTGSAVVYRKGRGLRTVSASTGASLYEKRGASVDTASHRSHSETEIVNRNSSSNTTWPGFCQSRSAAPPLAGFLLRNKPTSLIRAYSQQSLLTARQAFGTTRKMAVARLGTRNTGAFAHA